MWLLPVFGHLASLAARTFYHLRISGEPPPSAGPVLLVANHPNSLLDPALVAAAARRPVRFLAKAPLFSDPRVGWLVRGSGAVPVYRRADDPSAMGRNDDTFHAVWEALALGDAVGIFPEGTSHSASGLVTLKTGAARIALGAAARTGAAIPVIPVGLSFRDKGRFRSEALAVIGRAVAWDDLAGAGPDGQGAVRALTERIDAALRGVTVNLERWEDAPLVEGAERIVAAERGGAAAPAAPGARLERVRLASEALRALRGEPREGWEALARDVRRHLRVLRVLGLRPEELHTVPRASVAAEWLVRQFLFFGVGAPLAALGALVFVIPYRLTGTLERRARPDPDVRATHKLLVGAVLHGLWVVSLAALAGVRGGTAAGVATLLALPPLGLITVQMAARWEAATAEVRRFAVRSRRRALLYQLRKRQHVLATRLEELRERLAAPAP